MVSYKNAGVDIDAGEELVQRLKKRCPELGGFGGLFPLGDSYLVAGTDGVGTKLKLAFEQGRHNTVGIDLVAMCVNDIITTGAKPLFFLDYYATSKLDVDQAESVLSGVISGCEEAGCVLLGGETAEMPGFYQLGEYDICGFCVGIVKKDELIDGSTVVEGDVIVGIPSSGIHSNGFSLVRKVLKTAQPPEADLLIPTRIYVKELEKIKKTAKLKGISHITGGGLLENIPRMLTNGHGAEIDTGSWHIPDIFDWIRKNGNVEQKEMFRIFNMGIGMAVVCNRDDAKSLAGMGYSQIGKVVKGEGVTIR